MKTRALFLCTTLSCGAPHGSDTLNVPDGSPIQKIGGEPAASGSRLKMQVLVGSDGSRQPWGGFWDSARGEACGVSKDENGDFRCFPGGNRLSSPYFLDAACTTPLFATLAPFLR
jgi:hypothetical protein